MADTQLDSAPDAPPIASAVASSAVRGSGASSVSSASEARETRHADALLALVSLSSGSDPLPSDLSSDPTASGSSTSSSGGSHEVLAALSRTFAALLAILFKRPIRLFRPVKISTWAGLQAIAEERGKSVSPSFVRGLIRAEGWRFVPRHILPPLVVNATVGFILFFSYAATSVTLSPALPPGFTSSAIVVPFVSGAVAGAAQSIVSTPLDNARLLLLRRQRLLALARAPRASGTKSQRAKITRAKQLTQPFTGWWHLLRDAVFRPSVSLAASLDPSHPPTRLERARAMAASGYTAIGLVAIKDGISFGSFFLVFSLGRRLARKIGLMYDGLEEESDRDEPSEDEGRRRTGMGIVLQSFIILTSGGVAGWVFSLVARPFDRARGVVMEGREKWARETAAREAREAKFAKRDQAQPSAGRRTGRVRTQAKRKRKVGRTFLRRFRRKEKLRTAQRAAKRAHDKATKAGASAPPSPSPDLTSLHAAKRNRKATKTTPLPSKPPSELQLIRQAAHRYGLSNFLLSANPTLNARDRIKPSSSLTKPLAQVDTDLAGRVEVTKKNIKVPKKAGPTRLSARGHFAEQAVERASGGWMRRGQRVLAFVPPYAVGFFVYALLNGDLGT